MMGHFAIGGILNSPWGFPRGLQALPPGPRESQRMASSQTACASYSDLFVNRDGTVEVTLYGVLILRERNPAWAPGRALTAFKPPHIMRKT